MPAASILNAYVMDDFPVVPEGGFIGSMVWTAWIVVVAVFLLRAKPADTIQR
ncbi:MAG: hypothetical protein KJ064_17175 [Anaerolineae bacterium]|nr:hypothetical protein [Anaerolineae bacterium]